MAELNQKARQVQALLEKVMALREPGVRELLQECLESILGLYGDALGRISQVLSEAGPEGAELMRRLARDPGVSGLLIIHGLHPVDLEGRLRQALESVRPYLVSHGGNVELLGIENDVARLRLKGTCQGCPSSTVTLDLAIRRAIEEACPDLAGFQVENG